MRFVYGDLFKVPGAPSFVLAAFIGRLPIAMVSLGIVLLVTAHTGSYARAGAMSATCAVAAAVISPFGARFIDRYGQALVVPILTAFQILALVGFVLAAGSDVNLFLQLVLLIIAGGLAPNIGSLVRARWAAVMRERGGGDLKIAFAWEAVVDEMVFVIGPPLVTIVALEVSEEWALIMCATLIAVGAGWLSVQRKTQPEPNPQLKVKSHGRILGIGMVVVVSVMGLMGGVFGSFEVTTVAFASEAGREPLTGLVLALYAAGSLLTGLVFGAVTMSRSPAELLPIALTVLAVVVIPMPFVPRIELLAVAAFVAGMSVSPVLIICATIVEELVSPARLTEALTLTISGVAVGLALGSTASGVLIDTFGAAHGYWIMTGSGVAGMLISWLGSRAVANNVARRYATAAPTRPPP